jgi:hypothetical protein
MKCMKCSDTEMVRHPRKTFLEFVISCVGCYPYICRTCFDRRFRLHLTHFAFTMAMLVAVTSLATGTFFVNAARHLGPSAQPQFSRTTDGLHRNGKAQNAPVMTAPTTPAKLRNDDVAELVRAGLGRVVLLNLIRQSECEFQMNAAAIVALKKAGTPDDVISAMLDMSLLPQSRSVAGLSAAIAHPAARTVRASMSSPPVSTSRTSD